MLCFLRISFGHAHIRDDGPAETYFLDNLDGGLYSAANQNRKKTGAEAEDNGDVGSEASADAAVAALVSYVNSKAGTSRLVGGALEPSAGRVPAADAFLHTQAAAAFFVAEEATSPNAVETAMAALRKASTDSAAISVYVAVLEKVRSKEISTPSARFSREIRLMLFFRYLSYVLCLFSHLFRFV